MSYITLEEQLKNLCAETRKGDRDIKSPQGREQWTKNY
jgi:hypothetical protein